MCPTCQLVSHFVTEVCEAQKEKSISIPFNVRCNFPKKERNFVVKGDFKLVALHIRTH